MKRTFLLIACSNRKSLIPRAPAYRIYTGSVLHKALRLARHRKWTPLILSSKYGFISPEKEIINYNNFPTETYKGPWPKGTGYYIGGPKYFSNVPTRFKPLLPGKLFYGEMQQALNRLLKEKTGGIRQGGETACKPVGSIGNTDPLSTPGRQKKTAYRGKQREQETTIYNTAIPESKNGPGTILLSQ